MLTGAWQQSMTQRSAERQKSVRRHREMVKGVTSLFVHHLLSVYTKPAEVSLHHLMWSESSLRFWSSITSHSARCFLPPALQSGGNDRRAAPQSDIPTSIHGATLHIRKESDHCPDSKWHWAEAGALNQADAGVVHIGQTDGSDRGGTSCPLLPDSSRMVFKRSCEDLDLIRMSQWLTASEVAGNHSVYQQVTKWQPTEWTLWVK